MRQIDRIDLSVLMCEILKPDMIEAGIIPKDHKWEDTTEEQAKEIKEFIKKTIDQEKEALGTWKLQ